jgi:uncharacterized membrane protein SpoIIM required for sporulation
MKESVFVAKNEENWRALEAFNARLQKRGIKKAGTGEVREFARLLRIVGFHLAYAKTHYPNGNTVIFLNRLVGNAHNFFYVRERGSFAEIAEFFSHTLPKTVRETYKYWVCATAFFMLGALFAAFYIGGDAARAGEIIPEQVIAGWSHFGETSELELYGRDSSFMTAFYATNNTAVAFNSFALGILAGLGTLYVLFYNGLIIGGLSGYLHAMGADMLIFYSMILPHGILELAAIFFAGGGGLMIGKGILIPGEFTRTHSLIFHARKAAKLIPLIVILMIIAALIEGFFSFTITNISPWLKLGFAALTAVGLAAYCLKGAWR